MDSKLPRREFLKAAQAAAGMVAYFRPGSWRAANVRPQTKAKAAGMYDSSRAYTPVPDYPIQPKRYSEVKMNDTFWKPKITTNAEVTIPFEVQKLTESGLSKGFRRRRSGGRNPFAPHTPGRQTGGTGRRRHSKR